MKLRREAEYGNPKDPWAMPQPYRPPSTWGMGFIAGVCLTLGTIGLVWLWSGGLR